MKRLLISFLALLTTATLAIAGPPITLVLGPDAPDVERLAADELARQLQALFQADVQVADKRPAEAKNLILLGNPATNPAIRAVVGDGWPKLSERGHLLRTVEVAGQPALILGGSSPRGTFFAASELAYRFGIRSFLHGDLLPHPAPNFHLDGFNLVIDAKQGLPAWVISDADPSEYAGWGQQDLSLLFLQLAKLKFEDLIVHLAKEPSPTFRTDGDTAGRRAFRGVKRFENPDLAGIPEADRQAGRERWAKEVVAAAAKFGMTATIRRDLPPETRKVPGVLPRFPQFPVTGVIPSRLPGELSVSTLLLSRGEPATSHLQALLQPIYGETAPPRIAKGLEQIAAAGKLLADNEPQLDTLRPGMIDPWLSGTEPPPVWWKTAAGLYTEAMNEMYRGIRASYNDPARPALLYHAKRCEFALHFLNAAESVRLAAVARSKADRPGQIEQLEKAVESMYNALSALGDVARDPSDRGTIAALNEYAYRPLKAALEQADKATRD